MQDLTQHEWREAMALLDHVMDLEPEEQRAVLDASTAPTRIREVVARLLSHEEGEGDVLDRGAFHLIAPVVGEDDRFDETAVRALETLSTGEEGVRTRPDDLESGMMIGPYRIERLIGRGGMGEVYLAERDDDAYTQKVALKLVRVQGGGEIEARFQRERQILAGLRHEHIARLLDGGMTERNRPYLVMEYVDGVTITDYANANSLDIDQRLAIFEQACHAVRYAHRRAIIHRDLKPSNLVVEERSAGGDGALGSVKPVVKLLDFGIAKLLEPGEEEPLTRAGERLMTPEYAAPEQVAGEPVTTSTDVYQLGVLMYELLTGQRPFYEVTEGKSGRARVRAAEDAILQKDPERPSQVLTRNADTLRRTHGTDPKHLAGRVRGDLDAIARKALRKDPDGRYASVDDLLDDLYRYRNGRPVEARRGTWTYRTKKFLRRNRTSVVAGTAVAALLAMFVVSLIIQTQRLGTALTEARTESEQREEVQELFTSILNVAEPSPEYSDTLTVRDMLNRTAVQAHRKFGDYPRLKAWTYQRLASYERDLGEYERSIAFGDTAVTMYDSLYRAANEDRFPLAEEYVYVLIKTAESLTQLDQLDRSLVLRKKAVEVIDEIRTGSSSASLSAGWFQTPRDTRQRILTEIVVRSSYLSLLNDVDRDRADDQVQRINTLIERIWEMDKTTRVDDLTVEYSILAAYYKDEGKYAVADSLYRLSLVLSKEKYGDVSPQTAGVLNDIAVFENRRGNHEQAYQTHSRILQVARQIYGEDHPTIMRRMESLASTLVLLDRYEEAVPYFQEAIEIAVSEFGVDHTSTLRVRLRLANAYNALDQFDEAIPVLREVLRGRQERFGARSIDAVNVHVNLAASLRRSGDLQGALEEQSIVLDIVRDRYPDEVTDDIVRTTSFRRVTRPYIAALHSRVRTLEELGKEAERCQTLVEYDRVYNESPIGPQMYGEDTKKEIKDGLAACDRRYL